MHPSIDPFQHQIENKDQRMFRSFFRSASSEICYFSILAFFLEFRRLANLPLNLVKETVSTSSFHYCQTQLEGFLDDAKTDKRNAKIFGLKAAAALAAYKQLLLTSVHWDGMLL